MGPAVQEVVRRKGDGLEAGAEGMADETRRQSLLGARPVERDPKATVGRLHRLALHDFARVEQVELGGLRQVKQRGPIKRPGKELVCGDNRDRGDRTS